MSATRQTTPAERHAYDRDRIAGMIYGAAYGDALGAPHEFRRDRARPEELIMCPLRRYNRFRDTWSVTAPGQFTDDTEMAMTLMSYLARNEWHYPVENPAHLVADYSEWANSSKFIGRNTRALMQGVRTYRGYLSRFRRQFADDGVAEQALSNGALMRSYPLALVDNIDEAIQCDCFLTNPARAALAAEQQYIRSLIFALQGATTATILGDYDLTRVVDVTRDKGLCTHGLYCSYYGLHRFRSFNDAIKGIILLGGDTDTNAAIAGALLGAFYGWRQMSSDPELAANWRIVMQRDISAGDYQRPEKYAPQRLRELLAAATGEPAP